MGSQPVLRLTWKITALCILLSPCEKRGVGLSSAGSGLSLHLEAAVSLHLKTQNTGSDMQKSELFSVLLFNWNVTSTAYVSPCFRSWISKRTRVAACVTGFGCLFLLLNDSAHYQSDSDVCTLYSDLIRCFSSLWFPVGHRCGPCPPTAQKEHPHHTTAVFTHREAVRRSRLSSDEPLPAGD